MIQWRQAQVVQILSENDVSQTVKVAFANGEEGTAYNDVTLHAKVEIGDVVLLNATAVNLKLGSGGYYFVAAISRRRDQASPFLYADPPYDGSDESDESEQHNRLGHMMKLRYTPFQMAVLAAEEEASPYHEVFKTYDDLAGLPVLIGELHIMLPAIVSWLHYKGALSELKLVYIMTDGGALPINLSRHVAQLKRLEWIQGTITYGHAYGGDLEAMNKYTALLAAKWVYKADLAIVAMGPGIVGTGTPYGHTGLETGEVANAVKALNGSPILIPRISFHDQRSRHFGLSHHCVSVLSKIVHFPMTIPLPRHFPLPKKIQLEEQLLQIPGGHQIQWIDDVTLDQVKSSHQAYPLPITTMERGFDEDPYFFLTVAAAAEWAWKCWNLATVQDDE